MALFLFLATGEIALRIVYHDAGLRTLGGPGPYKFEHLMTPDDLRGRMDVGPKTPGVPRLMMLGDSITWGAGVYDWRNTWPELLLRDLEHGESHYEAAVFADSGRDIQAHVNEVDRWLETVNPDVFIYQWYVNDIEVSSHRPREKRSWQEWSAHRWLRARSYLYFLLDKRLATYLPPLERSYVDYLVQDYAPGTAGWAEFERYFNTLAMRVKERAKTRILILYPQVPFRGRSPLQPIYDGILAFGRPHLLVIPPADLVHYAGEYATVAQQPALRFAPAPMGPVIDTREYYFAPGDHEIDLTVSIDANVATFGTLDVVDAQTNEVLGTAPLHTTPGGWHDVAVHVTTPERAHFVRLRVTGNGQAPFSLARVAFPVDYGFEVVDLTGPLNTFNTHASIFDAHPNERAHRVMAEKVARALRKSGTYH
jgi:hypothetical protein